MEKNSEPNKDTVSSKSMPFSKNEDMIMLLKAIFKSGFSDLPSDILPGKTTEERQSAMRSMYEQTKSIIEDKPTIINWLQRGLFVEEESNVPLAVLFIEWFEQHPSSDQENEHCNFREIYHFIYKMMMNEPVSHLSQDSAKILYTLLSEVIDEVSSKTEDDVMAYLNQASKYSRSGLRKTYSRK